MAPANILSVGQFFLLNNSFVFPVQTYAFPLMRYAFPAFNSPNVLKFLNVFKKDYSVKKVINFGLVPPKPKKPSSPYVTFQTEKRNEIVANNPGKSFKEISQLLSAQWKNLSECEKNKYHEKYLKEHALYKNELLEYNENYGEIIEDNKKLHKLVTSTKAEKKELKKKQMLNNKPQFPKTCYRLFIQESIKKLGSTELQGIEKLKKSAELWRNMSEEDKDNFKKIYQERYEQYEKDLSVWEENMVQAGKQHLVRANKARKKFFEE